MRTMFVTDLRLYREGVANALLGLTYVSLVATADSASSAVLTARRTRCDAAIVDMSMRDSVESIQALRLALPNLKVIAQGVDEAGFDVIACAELGISGFVKRNATVDELGAAIRSVGRGEAYISGAVAAGLLRHISQQARTQSGGPLRLTRREHDVLTLLQSGLANKEIARALDIQLSTVKNHVHNLLSKMGACTRGDLIGYPRPVATVAQREEQAAAAASAAG